MVVHTIFMFSPSFPFLTHCNQHFIPYCSNDTALIKIANECKSSFFICILYIRDSKCRVSILFQLNKLQNNHMQRTSSTDDLLITMLVSCGGLNNKVPQKLDGQQNSLIVLEARSLNSRCGQLFVLPPKAPGKNPSLPSFSFSAYGSVTPISDSIFTWLPFQCVCLSSIYLL